MSEGNAWSEEEVLHFILFYQNVALLMSLQTVDSFFSPRLCQLQTSGAAAAHMRRHAQPEGTFLLNRVVTASLH